MDRAGVLWTTQLAGVDLQVLNWPLTVMRLRGDDADVVDLAQRLLAAWRDYDDAERGVVSRTGDTPHNTITPIARREAGRLRLDLVLRNNRTSAQHPDGIFHPHAHIHPVKKENIGLIEVMGLAVLPDRLERELRLVAEALVTGDDVAPQAAAHAPLLAALREKGPATDPDEALQRARIGAGAMFVQGLEHCGVFGDDAVEGCTHFLDSL
jgi:UDPglucose--hexose-1-phosphate uridylyltransferase